MFIYVVLSITLILGVLGLTDIIHGIWLRLLRPQNINEGEYLVYLSNSMPYEQYRYFIEKYRWEIDGFAEKLIFIYEGELPAVLNQYVGKYSNVIFAEKNSFFENRR